LQIPVFRLPVAPPSRPVEVALSQNANAVRIEVPIADDRHPGYEATVEDSSGALVFEAADLTASGPGGSVVLTIPEERLVAADYTLKIEGEKLRGAPGQIRTSLRYVLRIRRTP
jgi:hypothetical protein